MAKKRRTSQKKVFFATGVIALAFLVGTVFAVKSFLLEDGQKKKRRQIHMLRLVEPPPPPPPKEQQKPPEPELKKEEIKQPEQKKETAEDRPHDGPKPGNQLGLDAEGSGGTDGFGLVAKKGGVPLIGSGSGQWNWYTRMVQDEIQRALERLLQENGGIPKGRFQIAIKVTLDDRGRIVGHSVYSSSGNETLDRTLQEALKEASLKEPPPEGMPKTMKLRVVTQG